jgi:hypothetical protein
LGLIPPFYFDCVVAIGSGDSEKPTWVASAFLYGHHTPTIEQSNRYGIFLVTTRHVFEGLQQVYVRFNPQKPDEPARPYELDLLDENDQPLWLSHPNKEIDIAVIPLNYQELKKEAIQANYFRSNQHVADIQKLNDLGIIEGDFAYRGKSIFRIQPKTLRRIIFLFVGTPQLEQIIARANDIKKANFYVAKLSPVLFIVV